MCSSSPFGSGLAAANRSNRAWTRFGSTAATLTLDLDFGAGFADLVGFTALAEAVFAPARRLTEPAGLSFVSMEARERNG